MVGDAGNAAVHLGAAELLGGDDFAGRGAHQGRPAEKDRPLPAHDDELVRHRRDIGAARRARAHDQGDLRNAGRRQPGLIVEDAPEMLAVGKDLVLRRQKRPARIDQIEAGQPVVAGDLLRAEVLLDGHREIGAALDRRVIGDDDAFAAHDPPDAGDDPGRRHLAVIHAEGGELRQFEKRRPRVEQCAHPLARQQFAAREVPAPRRLPAALADRRDLLPQIRDERPHRRGIRRERLGAPVERRCQDRHFTGPTLPPPPDWASGKRELYLSPVKRFTFGERRSMPRGDQVLGQPVHAAFCGGGKGRFPGLDQALARRRLRLLDEAERLEDLTGLASVGLHRLPGARRGRWAISTGGPWRITFEFRDGDARNVEIVDYH